jgi:deazaflavin-dependent oxidoreductase (nitroreductase family)
MDARNLVWPVIQKVFDGHMLLYRASGGRVGHHLPGAPPMLLLDHVGAKSGRKRTSPLGYFTDGDDPVIVASKGGHPRHPAWYHNLMANPDTTIQLGTEKREVHARPANPDERARLWPKAVETYRGYGGYQERTDRVIPLVILERRSR